MLTLEWKITMSLSYYMAYQKKKNKLHERERYVRQVLYNLNFTEKKINDLISENS